MSIPHFTSPKQPSPALRTSAYAMKFSFRNSKDLLVSYDQSVVSLIKVLSPNEIKLTIGLTEDNATDILFLVRRGKTLLIHELDLFSTDTNISTDANTVYPVLTDSMFVVEGSKLTPLGRTAFTAAPVNLTLHLFAYNGDDVEEIRTPH